MFKKNTKENDLMRVVIQDPALDFPITIPFLKRSAITPELIMSEIKRMN